MKPIDQTDGLPEVELWPAQDEELFGCDDYFLVFVCGGRGSGKTKVNPLHFLRRGQLCTEQPYALCANTWDQLINAILPPIQEVFAEIGWQEDRDYVFGKRVPKSWRREWVRKGIRVPTIRLRNIKMLICRNGLHIYLLTLANQSWRRIKGHEIQALFGEEMTEPDVPLAEFLTYAIGSVRCGKGREDECRRRGHLHQVFIKFNVPLHNPSHPVFRIVENYQAKEKERKALKKGPFFKLIEASTQENKALPSAFLDQMRDALDGDTFEEQTSGRLIRRTASLTYHRFSEQNILESLKYDPKRPLHIWFDFNTTPACAGWGHDLRWDEVPEPERKAGHEYFGVIGELFTDNDPMHTDQVAQALIEDPSEKMPRGDQRCNDCGRTACTGFFRDHVPLGDGKMLCTFCGAKCSGVAIEYAWSKKYIHAPSNWRGLAKHRGMIYVYGDASGRSEHAAAVKGPCLKILRDTFGEALEGRVEFRIKDANPPVRLRELAVNRSLCAANGIRTLFFSPVVVAHIADCREVVPGPDGVAKKVQISEAARKKGDEYFKRTHCLDGLGYKIDYTNPAHIPKAGGMPATADGPDFGPLATDWPEP